jgi:hypothetical protein
MAQVLSPHPTLHTCAKWGFKILVDKLSHKHNEFWLESKILTNQNILRMGDASLVSELVIAMCEGIQSKKQIRAFYGKYEKSFDHDTEILEDFFDNTIKLIKTIFNEGLKNTPFRRIHLFYTLFTSIYHTEYSIKNIDRKPKHVDKKHYERLKITLTDLNFLFNTVAVQNVSSAQIQFLEDSRRATTDTKVRIRRSEFIIDIINGL